MGNIFESRKNQTQGNETSFLFNQVNALIGSPSFGGIIIGAGIQSDSSDDGTVELDAKLYSFNAGWGKNFVLGNGTTLKPQIIVGFIKPDIDVNANLGNLGLNDDVAAYGEQLEHIITAGVGVDWVLDPKTAAERVWSFGYGLILPSVDMGDVDFSMHLHTISASYKQTYNLSSQFSAGFNAGASIVLIKTKLEFPGMSEKSSNTTFTPHAGAAFTYRFNSPFSLNAGINAAYPVARNNPDPGDATTTYQGFRVRTTAGGTFQPHPSLAVDFGLATGYYRAGLDNVRLAVRYKK
jgi:hypothetical protein